MKKAISTLLIAIAIAVVLFVLKALWSYLTSPPIQYVFAEKYFVCNENKILYGGLLGKGPIKKYPSDDEWCWYTEWEEIDRNVFKNLATKWHGVVWVEEAPWWQNN